MSATTFLSSLLGLLAGAAFVFQQTVNASLRNVLQSVAWAGFTSYLGGTVCMAALAALLREPFPNPSTWSGSSGLDWTGGLFGAIYIAISIFVVPRIGAAAFVALFVAGQMAFSVAVDHYGLLGLAHHAASAQRVLGALLIIGGAWLVSRA
jgi:transporter family-2 protein